MSSSNPTTGLGVAAQIVNVPKTLTLSLSGLSPLTTSYELAPEVADAAGTVQGSGTPLVLTAVANSTGSPGHAVYTGTITGGGIDSLVGQVFTVAGFVTNTGNNGTFLCLGSTVTTLTLGNPHAIAESASATATSDDSGGVPFTFISRSPGVVAVTETASPALTGVLEAVAVGQSVVEVSYPTFNNTFGTGPDGLYVEKIYAEITVQVVH